MEWLVIHVNEDLECSFLKATAIIYTNITNRKSDTNTNTTLHCYIVTTGVILQHNTILSQLIITIFSGLDYWTTELLTSVH